MSTRSSPPSPPGFDGYADDYDSALNRGLAVSGEGREYYLFIFPRLLGALRVLEPLACRLPLGAQYQLLCRRRSGPIDARQSPTNPGEPE
jgi:hypothetical protein